MKEKRKINEPIPNEKSKSYIFLVIFIFLCRFYWLVQSRVEQRCLMDPHFEALY